MGTPNGLRPARLTTTPGGSSSRISESAWKCALPLIAAHEVRTLIPLGKKGE